MANVGGTNGTPATRPGKEGRYRTLRTLGRGGMGTVELAVEHCAGGVDRIVALKRLLPEAKARHAEMFLREARLATMVRHPNVVRALDFGEYEGEPFMAMEYVEGESLSRVLTVAHEADFALEWPLVVQVLADVCDGLHAAHELVDDANHRLGVVHRDVSPHNVMLSYGGEVKLLDFGVAKISTEHGLTRTGEVKGKVAYMSPEQAMGDPLDRRSDLYSVGAVLFECLAGRRMWEGTDLEVIRKLALEKPPRLKDAAPGIPDGLAALFDRLVARHPDERPATAEEVARALRGLGRVVHGSGAHDDIASLMSRLFGEGAAGRRAELERALSASQLDAVELDSTSDIWERPNSIRAWSRRRPPHRLIWGGAALLLMLATGIAVSFRMTGGVHETAVAPSAGTAPRSDGEGQPSLDHAASHPANAPEALPVASPGTLDQAAASPSAHSPPGTPNAPRPDAGGPSASSKAPSHVGPPAKPALAPSTPSSHTAPPPSAKPPPPALDVDPHAI